MSAESAGRAEAIKPRSILKPTKQSTSADTDATRQRETALHHANLIQQRKDIEFQILSSLESLIELPSDVDADPANPSSEDSALVINSLASFQPSDYDALIEERNINRKCGYALCPRVNKLQDTQGKFRILFNKGGGQDAVRFINKKELEKWCSDECGRRALFLKVQINEEPAWSRGNQISGRIVLLDSQTDKQDEADSLANDVRNLSLEASEDAIVERMKALALERGDQNAPSRSFGLAEINVQESSGISQPQEPRLMPSHDPAGDALLIEGHRPRPIQQGRSRLTEPDLEEEGDVLPTI